MKKQIFWVVIVVVSVAFLAAKILENPNRTERVKAGMNGLVRLGYRPLR